jgi:hypothetical protein
MTPHTTADEVAMLVAAGGGLDKFDPATAWTLSLIIAKTAAGDDKENPVCEVRSRCSALPSSYSPAVTQVTS